MFFRFSPEKSLISQVEEFRFLSCMSPFWIPFLGCSRQTRDRGVPAAQQAGVLSPRCLELLAHDDNKMRFVSLLFLNVGGCGPPDQQHQPPLGTCQGCRLSDPTQTMHSLPTPPPLWPAPGADSFYSHPPWPTETIQCCYSTGL